MTNADISQDQWAQWLLQRRHGGDEQRLHMMLDWLYPVRDKVLQYANLKDGDVLLDVGAGDGLIAFGALQQNLTCRVIFSDVSQDLLDHCRDLASTMGVLNRCEFVLASADDLHSFADASVDVVTTRSVLIYVADKQQAFREFHRVLKPGGRLSIFEPINRFSLVRSPHGPLGFDVTLVQDLADKVQAVYHRYQPPGSDPMLDFDERDLLDFAEQTGFREIHLELHADIEPPPPIYSGWESLIRTAPNPKVPTLEEAMQEALTPEEAERFVAYLRPRVEANEGVHRLAVVYLWAVK